MQSTNKSNNLSLTALYCRLSRDDGTEGDNNSISMMFYNEKRPHHHNAYQTPVKRESSFFQRVDTILD